MKQSVSKYPQLGANMLYNDQETCILKTSNFPVLFRTNKNWLKTVNWFISQEAWDPSRNSGSFQFPCFENRK